ncbi:hypothetical protein D3C80_1336850 [compost metagenome]
MKKQILSALLLSFLVITAAHAQNGKIKPTEVVFIQGGNTADETFGTTKPDVILVARSSTNTHWSRTGFLKFKIPQDIKSLNSVDLNISIKVYKNAEQPDLKFSLNVQAVPENTWSKTTITWNNAPKAGEVLGNVLLDQSLDDKLSKLTIKLDAKAVDLLLKKSKDREITLALTNNVSTALGSIVSRDAFLTIE